MREMNNRQRQDVDLYYLEKQNEKRRSDATARAAKDEQARREAARRAAEVSAWEEVGLAWLKEGEDLFGRNYDFRRELRILERHFAQSRILPYEDYTNLDLNLNAGFRAIFVHGLIALVLSFIVSALGLPYWISLIASAAYVVWRFRVRKGWLLKQRAEAWSLRAEIADPYELRALT